MIDADVHILAAEIGPRHRDAPAGLERAAAFLEGRLRGLGLEPQREACGNLVAELPGSEPVLLGAHYDSVPDVPGAPGADDNASGVAAVLELAARWRERPRRCGLRLVFFNDEERMRWNEDEGGSWAHAQRRDVAVAVILDSLACFDDRPGSQQYAQGWMQACWPSRGDFVAVQAPWRDRRLARRLRDAFRASCPLPAHGFWLPGWHWHLHGDHGSFARLGIPTVAFTDTDRWRNPCFHRETDRADSLDFRRLAQAVDGIDGALATLLAGEPQRDQPRDAAPR